MTIPPTYIACGNNGVRVKKNIAINLQIDLHANLWTELVSISDAVCTHFGIEKRPSCNIIDTSDIEN